MALNLSRRQPALDTVPLLMDAGEGDVALTEAERAVALACDADAPAPSQDAIDAVTLVVAKARRDDARREDESAA